MFTSRTIDFFVSRLIIYDKMIIHQKKIEMKRKYDVLDVDETGKLICTACVHEFRNFSKKNGEDTIRKHLNSEKHKQSIGGKRQRMLLDCITEAEKKNNEEEQFCIELVNAFTAANIPLSKVNNEHFKAFLGKYMRRKIPERTKLQTKVLE